MDEEPVEILVGMAERGEIDPWNIDIVEVTDRFLSELERRRELDLRVSGRTLFYAATLLRLKSEYLDEPEELPEDDAGEDLPEEETAFDFDTSDTTTVERLEREIQRRIARKGYRKRPVTLYELIKMLKTAEKEERRRQATRAPREEILITTEDIVATAHSEDFKEASSRVWHDCAAMLEESGQLTLRDLSRRMGWTVLDVYIPLLFLSLEGKLSIWQEQFFDELFIGQDQG